MAEDVRKLSASTRASPGDFGSALRSFRLASGLSQEELAERSGTGVNTIGALERGDRRAPYRSTVDALAEALGLTDLQRETLRVAATRRRGPRSLTAVPTAQAASVPAAPANNLPAHLTSFIGREREISDIMALVEAHRLVTLTGSGGVGKTRTALEAAADLAPEFADGVWLIELGPLAHGEYVAPTVAQTLEITLGAESDPAATIARALRAKDTLLLFDTCEHVIEAAARVMTAIVQGAPNVRILATSRQRLGITGEATYRLPPLAAPLSPTLHGITAAEAGGYDGVALFVERAARANDRFRLTDENARSVVEICRRLDGIALGIELAASRTKSLSPGQINERLDQRFRFLRADSRDVVPRQQTLRAMIDWSYELLDEREQRAFVALAIFVKGFPLEDAIAVASSDTLDAADVVDILESLVEKSLVNVEPAGDSVRYSLLDSNREYAWEKLQLSGALNDVRGRQLRALRDRYAALRTGAVTSGRQNEFVEPFIDDLDNIRAALDCAQTESDFLAGAKLLVGSGSVWAIIGRMNEGIARIQRSLDAIGPEDSSLRGVLCIDLAQMLLVSGAVPSRVYAVAAEAVACARTDGSPKRICQALCVFAWVNIEMNQFAQAESALTEAQTLPGISLTSELSILERRAQIAERTGDLERAIHLGQRLREAYAALGNTIWEQTTVSRLAAVEFARGSPARSVALLNEILPGLRTGRDRELLAEALANVAGYHAAMDDLAAAERAAREGVGVYALTEPGHRWVVITIELLALVYALRGDTARAATLGGFADAALERLGYQREIAERAARERAHDVLSKALAPHELVRLQAEGSVMTAEMAVAMALSPLQRLA